MWGYTEIGVGIHGWVRTCCLCSAFTPVFTGGLFLDVSDRNEKSASSRGYISYPSDKLPSST